MRSWFPIKARCLDNKRLLGEHNELLIMARSLAGLNKGYRNHPETKRWTNYTKGMRLRHDEIANEMLRRGFNHKSPWPENLVNYKHDNSCPFGSWEPLEIIVQKLKEKQGPTDIELWTEQEIDGEQKFYSLQNQREL